MHKIYFILPVLLIVGLFLASCNKDTTNPVTPTVSVGSLYIQSTPAGAQIWVDGVNTTKITPDSVSNLTVGNHAVVLKLASYFDDTDTITVTEGVQTPVSRTLVADYRVLYDSIKVWESGGTSASQPSGIILSSGTASSIATAGVDIYYSTGGGLVLASMFDIDQRATSFSVSTNGTVLTDRVASPLSTQGTWVTQISDQTSTYFYLYDNDHHYSKMIITGRGNDGHKWLTLKWYYNKNAEDIRF
ncbi:MAG: PEGA domain-containing protein [Ignavibacteriaceae bacterium]|nr:PEGA domain-containing protein [Ignavibacteriaceae bacterium]